MRMVAGCGNPESGTQTQMRAGIAPGPHARLSLANVMVQPFPPGAIPNRLRSAKLLSRCRFRLRGVPPARSWPSLCSALRTRRLARHGPCRPPARKPRTDVVHSRLQHRSRKLPRTKRCLHRTDFREGRTCLEPTDPLLRPGRFEPEFSAYPAARLTNGLPAFRSLSEQHFLAPGNAPRKAVPEWSGLPTFKVRVSSEFPLLSSGLRPLPAGSFSVSTRESCASKMSRARQKCESYPQECRFRVDNTG